MLHPAEPRCLAAGSVPVHPSLSPCSMADCPQIQCVHPYVAQEPDELSLELADVLNILDKTDDGNRGWDGAGWKGGLRSRQAAAEQPGGALWPARDPGIGLTAEGARSRRQLLPPPNPQQIQAALSCGNTGTTTLAPAMGHRRAGTATPDISQSCSYLDAIAQPPGPGLWGAAVRGGLGHTGSLLGTTSVASVAAAGMQWQQCLLSAGIS